MMTSASASAGGDARPMSLWAVAALVVGIASACPLVAPVGLLLGVIALIQCGQGTHRGQRLAVLGIAIAFCSSVGWMVVGMWWHRNVREPLLNGPKTALVAAIGGDADAVRAEFHGAGATADDATIAAFGRTLRDRYGQLQFVAQVQTPSNDASQTMTAEWDGSYVIDYEFRFAQAMVPGRARFVVRDLDAGGIWPTWVFRWSSVDLIDPEQGELSFPPEPADNGGG